MIDPKNGSEKLLYDITTTGLCSRGVYIMCYIDIFLLHNMLCYVTCYVTRNVPHDVLHSICYKGQVFFSLYNVIHYIKMVI